VRANVRLSLLLCSIPFAALLLAYSQTLAFAWDEGFHLLAAQLIQSGKRPYLDFAFAQTPLNAYLNAAWMWLLGDRWRVINAVDAVLTTIAVVLAAAFLRSRWPEQGPWGWIAVLVLAGTNPMVVEFGTIGQAYALSLLLITAAFRFTTDCARRSRIAFAALAGVCSAAAAGSTLLTASAAPVLFVWLLLYSPSGQKLRRGAAFVAGVVVALVPLLSLVVKAPQQVIFDMFRYHMFYRRSDWPGATRHDLETFASFVDSPRALILGILAPVGVWFIVKQPEWKIETKREFYLCGWVALAFGLYTSAAHPTFVQYYVFTVPFLAILSAVGLSAIAAQMHLANPNRLAMAVCALACLAIAKDLYDKRNDLSWPKMEAIARKVNEVTAREGSLYADEPTYFLTKRTPPPGNEYISSHKLRLAPELSELVHIVPQPEWDKKIMAGEFDTLETCDDEDWIKTRKLDEIYASKEELNDCAVFWERRQKR
jgi:hypothetical protein